MTSHHRPSRVRDHKAPVGSTATSVQTRPTCRPSTALAPETKPATVNLRPPADRCRDANTCAPPRQLRLRADVLRGSARSRHRPAQRGVPLGIAPLDGREFPTIVKTRSAAGSNCPPYAGRPALATRRNAPPLRRPRPTAVSRVAQPLSRISSAGSTRCRGCGARSPRHRAAQPYNCAVHRVVAERRRAPPLCASCGSERMEQTPDRRPRPGVSRCVGR